MPAMFEATFVPSRSLSERLYRLRNYQSRDFWAMLFARPMTILLLLPVADLAWVTPNLITWVSVVVKAAGIAALLAWPGWGGGVVGVALINLGLVLDNMDGTLARYRGTSSYLGYYLDKSVDIICTAGMFAGIAFRTWWAGGEVLDLVMPFAGFAGASVSAYCKWVAARVETDVELLRRMKDGTLPEFAQHRIEQNPVTPPPERTVRDWVRFFIDAVKSIVQFNEVDIYFFLALAVVIGQPWLFTRVMCALYAAGLVIGPAHFYFKLRARLRRESLE
jgi:phosphatidylglycerophosphate synthase